MRARLTVAFGVWALAFAGRPAIAELSPMEHLARDLGTPKVGYTARNDAHTHSTFEFVRPHETVKNWTKLFTVVATRVDVARTQEETRATIQRLREALAHSHAEVSAYDVREQAPPSTLYTQSTLIASFPPLPFEPAPCTEVTVA